MQGKTDPTTPAPDLLTAIRRLYGDCICGPTYTCRGCGYLTVLETRPAAVIA